MSRALRIILSVEVYALFIFALAWLGHKWEMRNGQRG